MRKIAVVLASLGIAAVAFAGPAQAQEQPGERPGGVAGVENCFGQNVAWAAQHGQKRLRLEGFEGYNGIGGFSRGSGLSVPEIMELAHAYCAGE
jgi:hypothetical protein